MPIDALVPMWWKRRQCRQRGHDWEHTIIGNRYYFKRCTRCDTRWPQSVASP